MFEVTITVAPSSHPEFEAMLDGRFGARQMARRGTRAEMDALLKEIKDAAVKRGDVLLEIDYQF